MLAFAEANRIYNRYHIRVLRGHEEHVSIEESRRILSMSAVDQFYIEGFRANPDPGAAQWIERVAPAICR